MQAQSIAFGPDVATADRLSLWGEFVRRHIGELEADTFGDPHFDGRLTLAEHREVKIFEIAVSRHRVVRTPRTIRRDERAYVKVLAQLQGVARFEQAGRRLVLTPGEWSIYDATQPYSVSNVEGIRQAAIFLPRDRLTRIGIDPGRVVVRRFNRATDAGRDAFNLLVGAQSAAAPDDDLGESLADLVARATRELDRAPHERSLTETLRRQVIAFIGANLRDPALCLDGIAGAIGCSKRYLHKLFERESDTLNGYIWRQRLESVRHDFADPAQGRRTITDIAFSWGFSSSSHFSRLFREAFGVSPRRFRALASGAVEP